MSSKFNIINDMPKGWIRGKGQPKYHLKIYQMWWSMFSRVNNSPYYKDVKIYQEFTKLSYFVSWIEQETLFEEFCETCDKIMWSIDKDIKNPNSRNYYPQNMTLVKHIDNIRELAYRNNPNNKHKKSVIGISLDNNSVHLFPYVRYGKKYGYDAGHIIKCCKGCQSQHKGYKWYYVKIQHNKKLRKI